MSKIEKYKVLIEAEIEFYTPVLNEKSIDEVLNIEIKEALKTTGFKFISIKDKEKI